MTRKKKMSLPARLNQNTLTAADELLSGQDEDDLRDVDAMFESLLNNTFEEESASASKSISAAAAVGLGRGAAGTEPKSSSAQSSQSQGEAKYLQQQLRQQPSGTPSPSPSEYDTACDPWDDY